MVIGITACSRAGKSGVDELRYGFTTEPVTFDPLNPANTADGRSILFNVFEGLVKPDTQGKLQPCIAESWEIEQGGLLYVFKIRAGVPFHDGSILNPADVKFSLETAAAFGFYGLENIDTITLQNNNMLVIKLHKSDPEFLPYLTVGIVKAGNNEREKKISGTGPFLISNYRAQHNLVLRKFDKYWQKQLPYLKKITIVIFNDYDALITALRAGSIDGTYLTGAMAAQLNREEIDLFHSYSASVQLLALNNGIPELQNPDVRRAISYGINIQGIIDSAFFGRGEPSGSPIIPGLTEYYMKSLNYSYDPQKAQTLLKEAGFLESKKLSLEITVPSNYTMHVDTAQVIAQQLTQIGIDVKIKPVDWASWLSDVYQKRYYQATIISLDSPNVSPRSFLSRYQSNAGDNFINFKNADYDRVYNELLVEVDDIQRKNLYLEAQKIIVNEAASVYIQDIVYYKAFQKGRFAGVLNYPLYVIDFSTIYRIEKES
jgi:peptide/nickel transport system substrate-binding protein